MVAVEHLVACPHCRSPAPKTPILPCEDRLTGNSPALEYSRCGHCGLLFLSTRVKQAELGALYPEDYHPYRQEGLAGTARSPRARVPARGVLWFFHRVLPDQHRRAIAAHYAPPHERARFLDFGCG